MANLVTEGSKYFIIIMAVFYTYQCFTVFGYEDEQRKKYIFRTQSVLTFVIHFLAFEGMFLQTGKIEILLLFVAQTLFVFATTFFYSRFYPKHSRLIVNNMNFLLTAGFIMLTRLNFAKAVKQSVIAAVAVMLSLVIPMMIRRAKRLAELRIVYAGVGLIALASVLLIGQVSYGAKLGFEIAGFGIQPSEFVKLLFVFFVAASLYHSTSFRDLMITTALAAFHVLILVISKDLGAALIIFVVYLVMLYAATRRPMLVLSGLAAGSVAAVGAYYLFGHVKVRVDVWRDPFAMYDQGGYQVAQSLFAIGTGSWFGTGLLKGKANTIPVAEEDFIFSAIAEEMGLIFALCLILVCLSCYIMFLNIAMQLKNQFYKLVALGLGTCYIFQTFINIGGVTKFIPSTGVTLPLVSYGGSSVLSTLIMFAIIQGLYIVREDENLEKKRTRRKEAQTTGPSAQRYAGTGNPGSGRAVRGRQAQKTKKQIEK